METENREIIYDAKKENGLSTVELENLMKQWQTKLAMDDWSLSLKIVGFRREDDFRQSGDFIADPEKKVATILMTNTPWRGDEEYTLIHEIIHVLLYKYDKYGEDLILKNFGKSSPEHDKYLEELEDVVHKLTKIILERSDL